ncbi:GNAT family N-acetyltransferase [Massilia solisilvae]|uniref:GNAT family N-acetyltransferase n=1 Tax=Massilia solisilvae TaxID=1811225 RepID=A0ABT2BER2_9BURK|nr:GNAT family N-acetyltransferase [Massilia solisilvae]MCS0606996.1 GNAT family N-acetyltransferase [Massilia solisilvae]
MTSIKSEWISREQYAGLLGSFAQESVTLYHRLAWLDAVASGFHADVRFMQTLGAGGSALAVTPFMTKKKGPFRLIGTPLSGMYTEFCGPLLVEGLDPDTVEAVMTSQHRLLAQNGHYIEWGSKGEQRWAHSLASFGYVHTQRPTLVVDLSAGVDATWASFEGRARNMTRKSEKAGVVARTVTPDEAWIGAYYEMLRATFGRQGLAVPHPLSFYRQMIALSAAGNARCVAAEFEGRMVAACIFLVDRARMLYLSGVANEQGMTLAATSLLQWHAIREAIEAGVTEYDMGGLGVPSIDKFKRSFGGRDFAHHRWTYRSRLFGLAEPAALWLARKGWIRLGGK